MGIVVLAIAIMPMLGIGGMQLYRAETPGPMKDSKLAPRITESAKALWFIYLALTLMCLFAYWFAGMSFFDAIGHAFSTVAIGGFSTHDLSIGYFNSPLIESIAIIFMLLASANFSLHFLSIRNRTLQPYWQDSEYRFFLAIVLAVTAFVVISLIMQSVYTSDLSAIRFGVFHLVSIITTTGYYL